MEGESQQQNNKRIRDEPADAPPETKRLREAGDMLEILDADGEVSSGVGLADVIKSLEAEISPEVSVESGEGASLQPDLWYLLEASDDELGLPPPAESSTSSVVGGGDEAEVVVGVEAGFDRIWGFEDDVMPISLEGLEFGAEAENDDGVNFDVRLFDYPLGCEEFSWVTES